MSRLGRFIMAALMMLVVTMADGQNYNTLWKQADDAAQRDLPQDEQKALDHIVVQATAGRHYGQLMRAQLRRASVAVRVAPDSLLPAVKRLEQQCEQAADPVLRSVYQTVLSKIYHDNRHLADDSEQTALRYRQQALARPAQLAAVKADGYRPFVWQGADSELFGHDLLSVLGMELEAYDILHDYYVTTANRAAACLTALEQLRRQPHAEGGRLETSDYIRRLDSLLTIYADQPAACEVAIERHGQMAQCEDVTPRASIDFVRHALAQWGTWKRADVLRNAEQELTRPNFAVRLDAEVVPAQQSQTVRLSELRHISTLTMRLYRTQEIGTTELDPANAKDYAKLRPQLKELTDAAVTRHYTGHAEYELFEDSFKLRPLPPGVYLLEFSSPGIAVSRMFYFVSNVRLLSLALPDEQTRYEVVDAVTGHPLAGAQLKHVRHRVFAYTDADRYCKSTYRYGRYHYNDHDVRQVHTSLFTDRAIYRPGQTVSVAAVTYSTEHHTDVQVEAGRPLTIRLRDANHREVATEDVVTDDYGKASVRFTLPAGQLNGTFTIQTDGGSCSFRVEDYKRPTFQVQFDDVQQRYEAGDTLRVVGRALTYAGVPVQQAKVHYTVRRRIAFWWMNYSRYWQQGWLAHSSTDDVLLTGEAVTDADGVFTAQMPLTLPIEAIRHPMFYTFTVEADVTDQGGESHNGQLSLPVGTRATSFNCVLPDRQLADQLKTLTFHYTNAAGQPVDGTVQYRIDDGPWHDGAANAPLTLPGAPLASGEHCLEATCGTDTLRRSFVLFGINDAVPCTKTDDWFYVSASEFPRDGGSVTVQVGASDDDLHICYTILSGNKVLESGAIPLSNALWNRQFSYRDDYGNGLLLAFAWVKNGQTHTHHCHISKPLPDKQLQLQWETFRDRLTPGQQEEWRLKVKNSDGTPATAQLMAVLYDKSLDQLTRHSWVLAPSLYLPQPSTSWVFDHWGNLYASGSATVKWLRVADLQYSHFDEEAFPRYMPYGMVLMGRAGGVRMMKSVRANHLESAMMDEVAMPAMAQASEEMAAQKAVADADGGDSDAPEPQQEVQLRENLQETAFFYPAVETDADGNVSLKFTLPESLTTWRFIGVAHTKEMKTGLLDAEAVARKDIMIQPNVPRFVRFGDEAQLTARIFNTGEQDAYGVARLELVAPESGQTVYTARMPFEVKAGATEHVAFSWKVDGLQALASGLLICKVTAVGDTFSDGEQHYLPVLPDYERVTRTVPFTQHEPGTKTIDLTALFPEQTSQRKLTIEYTNHPAWLMMQSLPILGQPREQSAIDWAAAYYSNVLARSIIQQNPQTKDVFRLWKQEQGKEQTLESALWKNEELKDLLLEETPWVIDADREAEQKQRLADFFDENSLAARLSTAQQRMLKLQNDDGSFSWYPGMEGSPYITITIGEWLTRLGLMADEDSRTARMRQRALDYMDKEIVRRVEEMKREERKGHRQYFPSFTALRWLYVCALDGRQLSGQVKQANDYLIALLKKDIKRQTIYEKALSAVVFSAHGEQTLAADYVESLKQYTVYTEEMGRYYDTPRAGYSWYDYKIPTEVAAIEAIQRVTPADSQTVDEMRRWLLQEKRTQAWDTPINSVNAIYAFLNARTKLSMKEDGLLAVDGKPLELPASTAGIGYVKTAIQQPEGKVLTVTKRSDGTSWGTVYAQFVQKTTEVQTAQGGIKVKRELLGNAPLHVGDRVKVRITIETERDLDFVQVTDRRAACTEPLHQLTGYRGGAYCSPKDNATHYFFGGLSKGKHFIETEYYIDRAGRYELGTCTVQCAYAPEFRAVAPSFTLNVE